MLCKRFPLILACIYPLGIPLICDGAEIAHDIVVSHEEAGRTQMLVGGSFGSATYDKANDGDFTVSLFGEVRFNSNLGVSFGFADFGKAQDAGSTSEVSTLYVGLMGRLPVRRELALFARIGFDNWDYQYQTGGSRYSDTSTDLFYGIGLDYDPIRPNPLVIRFGLDFYPIAADFSSAGQVDETISAFNVGVMYKF